MGAFISLATEDISTALGCPRNIFTPLLKVSRVLLLAGANPNYVTTSLDSSPILGVYAHLGNREMVLLLLDYCAGCQGWAYPRGGAARLPGVAERPRPLSHSRGGCPASPLHRPGQRAPPGGRYPAGHPLH